MSSQEGHQARGGALVGHVDHLHTGRKLQKFPREMKGRPLPKNRN